MGSYAAELQDPSAIEFCLLVTGITTTLGGLSSGACLGFEEDLTGLPSGVKVRVRGYGSG